jgi:cell wall-associated NlpC family hydrolase
MRVLAATATALTVSAALVLGGGLAAGAAPLAHTDGYPSWQDVQNAEANEAAKQNEINVLNTALQQSQQKAAQAQQDEDLKEEAYNTAQAALDAATAKADALKKQQAAAQATADAAQKRADGVIASLDRTGGGDPTLGLIVGSGKQTDRLLSGIGSMNHLSASSHGLLLQAEYAKNAAASLAQQAGVAEDKRKDLAAQAQAAYATAQAAVTAADAEVASEEASQQTMFAQLAALKNTTAEIEAEHQKGVDEANAAAGIPALPPGAIGTVIEFAEQQLGKRYVLGGAGPTVWDCSGLTMVAWSKVGVDIGGHGSTMQYNHMRDIGHLVDIPRNSTGGMLPGDLIFYSVHGSASDAVKTHVAMYIGGGQMIEAPNPRRLVRIVPVRYSDYESRLVPQVGRIVM